MPDLKLVPIPTTVVADTAGIWVPFVVEIAVHIRCHPAALIEQVNSGEVQVFLAWDAEAKEARALAGCRILLRGDDRIAEMLWCTGTGREHWLPLMDELERYHREHLRCAGMKAVCRPGWKRPLTERGYRVTHLVMDREFGTDKSPD